MLMRFSKMHGLGNDFVVIDALRQQLSLTTAQIRWLADRHFGVGCDQLLLVEAPEDPANDFRYRIFNADGGEVEQCGNGARCFARFVHEQGLTDKTHMRVETAAGLIEPELLDDGQVRINMGAPNFAPSALPFAADAQADVYPLNLGGSEVQLHAVAIGNPHAVLVVDDVSQAPLAELGPKIETHPRFPQRVNVGFAQLLDPGHLRLRVWERGAGETQACGTGACAAAAVARRFYGADASMCVALKGGELQIDWAGLDAPIYMAGPAVTVFHSELTLP